MPQKNVMLVEGFVLQTKWVVSEHCAGKNGLRNSSEWFAK